MSNFEQLQYPELSKQSTGKHLSQSCCGLEACKQRESFNIQTSNTDDHFIIRDFCLSWMGWENGFYICKSYICKCYTCETHYLFVKITILTCTPNNFKWLDELGIFNKNFQNPWRFKIWNYTSWCFSLEGEYWTAQIRCWGPTKVQKINIYRLQSFGLLFSQITQNLWNLR